MTFYNKKMFADAGLEMPDEPTWDQIREFACALHDPANNQYGSRCAVCPVGAKSSRRWTP